MTTQQAVHPSLTKRSAGGAWEFDRTEPEGAYWQKADGETFIAYDQVSGGKATYPRDMMDTVSRKLACRCSNCQYVSAFERDVLNHINAVPRMQTLHSVGEPQEATRKDERVFECPGCESSFRTKFKAQEHMRRFRETEPNRHKNPQPVWVRQYGPSPPELADEDQQPLVQPFPDRPGENRSQQQGASGRRKRGRRGGRKR